MGNDIKRQHLNGLSVWAIAFGGIVGWGSFIMPGSTFLPSAGSLGSVIGIFIACLFAIIICINYSRIVRSYPKMGGSYMYTRHILGEDHAFLAVWCLVLAYVSVIGANTTATALMVRYLIGDYLRWGYMYKLYNYEVYAGEVVVAIILLVTLGLITAYKPRLANILRTTVAVLLFVSVTIIFIAVLSKNGLSFAFNPGFAPDNSKGNQILYISLFAPWLFVGFEAVTHTVGEYKFSVNRIFLFAGIAIVCGAATYIMLLLIGASSSPSEYSSWLSYVSDLDNRSGIEAVPVFYNTIEVLGEKGRILLFIATASGLTSGILVICKAGSRVLGIVAKYGLIPKKFSEVNENGVPVKACLLIIVISAFSPFVGRTLIAWNTDICTLSVSVVYAYISICTFKTEKKYSKYYFLGVAGALISVAMLVLLLIPNVFSDSTLSMESYFMLAAWSFLGLVYYLITFAHDKENRYGHSTIMWFIMLLLLFFSTNVWSRLFTEKKLVEEENVTNEMIASSLRSSSLIQFSVITLALFILFSLFKRLIIRQKQADMIALRAQEQDRAKSIFLSNMSHDIRTPMNAIVGMTDVLLRENLPESSRDYVNDIKNSSEMLLSLINDILDLSKIESGKIELDSEEYCFCDIMRELSIIFLSRIGNKPIELIYDITPNMPGLLKGDVRRIEQILTNIIGNATKYTDKGCITVTIDVSDIVDNNITLNISVTDTGRGIKKEDIGKLFNSFSQVDTKKNRDVEGTGLGLAICKNLIELMGGNVEVTSEYGIGSTFALSIVQEVVDSAPVITLSEDKREVKGAYSFTNEYEIKSFISINKRLGLNVSLINDIDDIVNGGYDYLVTDDYALASKLYDHNHSIRIALVQNPMRENYGGEPFEVINKPLSYRNYVAFLEEESYGHIDDVNRVYFTAPGAHILVVDDMPINRKVMLEILKPLNMHVDTAANGREAVEKIKKTEYDMVFMDHMMPVMDGVEAVTVLRASNDSRLKELPIVALTASATVEAKKQFVDAGLSDFISKPIHYDEAVKALKKWLPDEKIVVSDGPVTIVFDDADIREEDIDIPGIVTKTGVYNSGGVALLINLFGDIYDIVDERCDSIEEHVKNREITDYTIEVHALKSALKMIGAVELSDRFANLEKLGKKDDLDSIIKLTDGVLDDFRLLKTYLEPYARKNAEPVNEYDSSKVNAIIEELLKAMDGFDLEKSEEMSKELMSYEYDGSLADVVKQISKYVSDLDFDKARELIGENF